MPVIEALQRAREVDVEVVVARIRLLPDAREVREHVLVHVLRERRGRALLVVHGRVERERLVHHFDDLFDGAARPWSRKAA